MKRAIKTIEPFALGRLKTLDPFLFCMYHKDHYPAGDANMFAPMKGNGNDFDPSAEFRMYQGKNIPGFPQHPHRGMETVTATLIGTIDHTDSVGNAGRYGNGDLQWMTAGKGIVHGEMMPLINQNKPNTSKFFQMWLNLSKKNKLVNPAFVMHWDEEIPRFVCNDNKAKVTVWAGELNGIRALPPPPDSYASDPASQIGIFFIEIQPGGHFDLQAASGDEGVEVNRMVYFTEGQTVQVENVTVKRKNHTITLDASQKVTFRNPEENKEAVELFVLQGKPLNEPTAERGPFVMNSKEELDEGFREYRQTHFGGWPWKEDAMVFPRTKGRFSLIDGKETYPPVFHDEGCGGC